MDKYKVCAGCSTNLPFSEFHKHPKAKHGLNPKCKSCKNQADKTSRDKNPSRDHRNSKNFRERNPDYQSNYLKNNPDKALLMNTQRRVRKQANGIFIIKNKELLGLYRSACFYCGSLNKIQADHVIPIAKGGQHSIGNLVPACRSCNSSKSDKTIMEWRIYLTKINKVI